MGTRVYRKRGGGMMFVIGFLLLWSVGWSLGWGLALVTGHVRVNGRERTLTEAAGLLAFAVSVGVAIFGVVIRLLLGWLNDRIELTGSEVSWFDCLGRRRGKADLTEVRSVRDATSWMGVAVVVETERGNLRFGKTTDGRFDLRERLQAAARGELRTSDAPPKTATFVHPPAVVPKVYRYRFSALHLFSFLWLGGCLFIFGGAVTRSSPVEGSVAPFVAVEILFVALGVWMQLTGWVERVRLDADGIEWTDFLGRPRVQARLDEILGLDETRGEASALKIETVHGTVQASSYLWGYTDLKVQVRAVLAAREQSL